MLYYVIYTTFVTYLCYICVIYVTYAIYATIDIIWRDLVYLRRENSDNPASS